MILNTAQDLGKLVSLGSNPLVLLKLLCDFGMLTLVFTSLIHRIGSFWYLFNSLVAYKCKVFQHVCDIFQSYSLHITLTCPLSLFLFTTSSPLTLVPYFSDPMSFIRIIYRNMDKELFTEVWSTYQWQHK